MVLVLVLVVMGVLVLLVGVLVGGILLPVLLVMVVWGGASARPGAGTAAGPDATACVDPRTAAARDAAAAHDAVVAARTRRIRAGSGTPAARDTTGTPRGVGTRARIHSYRRSAPSVPSAPAPAPPPRASQPPPPPRARPCAMTRVVSVPQPPPRQPRTNPGTSTVSRRLCEPSRAG